MKESKKNPIVMIMAGGKGERFWPRSTESRPKQLHKVYSSKTLLQETVDRALTITDEKSIYIGCNADLKKAIQKTHPKYKKLKFVVEPEAKNTAAIIALTALVLEKKHSDQCMVVLSADHFISTPEEFANTARNAIQIANEGFLVTLGVKPSRPDIGYGYIEQGEKLPSGLGNQIISFKEKPDLVKASEFLQKGNFYWNSGIFFWPIHLILREFRTHAPEIIDPIENSMGKKTDDLEKNKKLKESFAKIPSTPVDMAILEKSKSIAMVQAGFQWDDVGSWLSLDRILTKDKQNNATMSGTLVGLQSSNNIVSVNKELIALLGVNDLILVEEGKTLFVATRESVGDIKNMLADLRADAELRRYLK